MGYFTEYRNQDDEECSKILYVWTSLTYFFQQTVTFVMLFSCGYDVLCFEIILVFVCQFLTNVIEVTMFCNLSFSQYQNNVSLNCRSCFVSNRYRNYCWWIPSREIFWRIWSQREVAYTVFLYSWLTVSICGVCCRVDIYSRSFVISFVVVFGIADSILYC